MGSVPWYSKHVRVWYGKRCAEMGGYDICRCGHRCDNHPVLLDHDVPWLTRRLRLFNSTNKIIFEARGTGPFLLCHFLLERSFYEFPADRRAYSCPKSCS